MKKSKESVDYSKGMKKTHCGNCRYFYARQGICDKVAGKIGAEMWCRLWKAKEDGKRWPSHTSA